MASTNDVTGKKMQTAAPSKDFDKGWDLIWGNKGKKEGQVAESKTSSEGSPLSSLATNRPDY